MRLVAVLHIAQQATECEDADQNGQEGKALFHRVHSEGETRLAKDDIRTDRGHEKPEQPGQQALDHVIPGKAGGHGKREDDQRKIVNRLELQPDPRELRGDEQQHDRGENAAEEA